jgi:MFS family permease
VSSVRSRLDPRTWGTPQAEDEVQPDGIFSRGHRSLTVASILGISIIAFEGLAVATVAPIVATDLGAIGLYAWVFSSFLLAQIVGTVSAGQVIDSRGAGIPFMLSLVVFGAGLVMSGTAPTMPVLIGGRALQGLGGGGLVAAIYVFINKGYPDRLRPRMLASISSAWVLPALIGPTIAGFLAERVSWRVVFLGLLPLLALVALLSVKALRLLPRATQGIDTGGPSRLTAAVLLSAATALLLAVLRGEPSAVSAFLAGAGLVVVAITLHRLLPNGTLLARPGLPAAIAARSLFVGGFFCVESFLILALTTTGGYSATAAGLVISGSALSWTLGSWTHERLDARDRGTRRATVMGGVALIGAGIAILVTPLVFGFRPTLAVALIGWATAGLGIGLAHTTSSTIAFALTPSGREGQVSASLQLADFFMPGIVVGLGGALVELARASAGLQVGIVAAFMLGFILVALALVAAIRLPRPKEASA